MEKVGDIYLLTNIERQYLGLIETERHWKLEKITERCWVYYEEDNLRKIIEVIQEGENNTGRSAGIAVHSAQHKVHAEISHQH